MKPNIVDKLVSFFSPSAGAQRARARMLEDLYLRKYDGADRGRRTAGWFTSSSSANSELYGQLSILRDRSRDLVRNNPYAAKAVSVIVANTVGTGIIPQVKDSSSARAKRYQDAWRAWGETSNCDASRKHDIYGLQSLALRTIVESGEVLIRRQIVRDQRPGLPPLRLQILEPDYLDTQKDGMVNGSNVIIQGIEYAPSGEVVAYWMFSQHPGDITVFAQKRGLISQRIPASEIKHVFRVDRPGQGRGVPWAAPVIIRHQDLDEYLDASIVKQKVAASFAGFIKEPDGVSVDINGKSMSISEKIEPGAIEILPPGKDIVFPSPPSVSELSSFTQEILHSIAAGYGITYEAMTGDYSRVNFSSGRMGWIEFQRNIEDWRWKLLIPQLCNPIFDWFVEAAQIAGVDGIAPSKPVAWTAPRREMIDPGKEINSMKDGIRAGLFSLSEALRSMGYDPEEMLQEIATDNEKIDSLGLKLDSDPRMINKAGAFQMSGSTAPAAPEELEEEEDEDDDEEQPVRYFVDEKEQLYKQTEDGIEKI